MRLPEVEKGDGFYYRILIQLISLLSGMRLPDAARIVMYHQDFYGKPMTSWTHAAMRGESSWSVGERELMGAMVAKWTSCPFCIDAHGSIAALELGESLVTSVLEDFQHADISGNLQLILVFLEKLIRSPDNLSGKDVQAAFGNGVTVEALEDAIAIATLFSITVRCANALNFAMLDSRDSALSAKRMLKQGYVFGKGKLHGRPDHKAMAEALRKRVLEGTGKTDIALRQTVAEHATGGSSLETPYDVLAAQIGEGAYKVTDELINSVVIKLGSEKAAFELIVAAAVSAGLYHWQRGLRILEEANQ